MRKGILTLALLLAMYFEVILVHFPFFFIVSFLVLFFQRGIFLAVVVFFLSLVLDSLVVNSFGVTSLFIFAGTILSIFYGGKLEFRVRMIMFVLLILASFFYSMVVGYGIHIFIYIFLFLAYGFFEYFVRREKIVDKKIISWV